MRRRLFLFAALFAALCVSPAFLVGLHAWRCPIEFHQFQMARLWAHYGRLDPGDWSDALRSACSSGWNIVSGAPQAATPEFANEEAMFDYVFSWLPSSTVVYPTEGFYYWAFGDGEDRIRGNLRVADLHKGRLSFAYFREGADDYRSLRLEQGEGLEVVKRAERDYDVRYRDKTVRFRIPRPTTATDALALLEDEEHVGVIHDESGIRLHLLFNHATNSFYDVLDESQGVLDSFADLGERLTIGERTGFLYYEDLELDRKLLVGVDLARVQDNDYFDGPGDQVPYDLSLRQKLYLAYPNTMLDGGVDDHGVYVDKPSWVRVAVSPYKRYANPNELLDRLASCAELTDKSELYTALTKEWWNTPTYRKWVMDELTRTSEQHMLAAGGSMDR